MSVINSMLRDLDRRHAPMPIKSNVQPAFAQPNRLLPRSAMALCVIVALAFASWHYHIRKPVAIAKAIVNSAIEHGTSIADSHIKEKTATAETAKESASKQSFVENKEPVKNKELIQNNASVENIATRSAPIASATTTHETTTSKTESPAAHPIAHAERNSAPEKNISAASNAEPASVPETALATKESAAIVKQQSKIDDDTNAQRYQLARAALAQNQPDRAYELLRDNPPPLANASDYHAVLAAIEQQLGHYADASLRYQQLLLVDPHQASWWLGLALSCEGLHRNADALAAYQRAIALNSLPDAARLYAITRMNALNNLNN